MQVKTNALTNTTLLAEYLELDATADASILGLCINSATAFIEGYTKRYFKEESRVQEILNPNKSVAILKAYPISSVASVIDEGGNSLEYKIKSKSAGIVEFTQLVEGSRVEITYTGGYVINFSDDNANKLPFDLMNLCNEIAGRIYNKRKSQGISSESMEGQNINWEKDLTPEMKAILEKYKNKTFF